MYRWPSSDTPGSSTTPEVMLANMSRCGVITLRMVISDRFMVNSVPSWASVGLTRMASSSSSICPSNRSSMGKKLSTSWSMIR